MLQDLFLAMKGFSAGLTAVEFVFQLLGRCFDLSDYIWSDIWCLTDAVYATVHAWKWSQLLYLGFDDKLDILNYIVAHTYDIWYSHMIISYNCSFCRILHNIGKKNLHLPEPGFWVKLICQKWDKTHNKQSQKLVFLNIAYSFHFLFY